jgi:hypothetical protein
MAGGVSTANGKLALVVGKDGAVTKALDTHNIITTIKMQYIIASLPVDRRCIVIIVVVGMFRRELFNIVLSPFSSRHI